MTRDIVMCPDGNLKKIYLFLSDSICHKEYVNHLNPLFHLVFCFFLMCRIFSPFILLNFCSMCILVSSDVDRVMQILHCLLWVLQDQCLHWDKVLSAKGKKNHWMSL